MVEHPMVMVVEDDVEMNQLQRELLEVHGIDTVAAYDGLEALEVSERCHADAVLLDLMLPKMDGFETCRQLKMRNEKNREVEGNGRNGKKLPIIMITALDNDDCRRLGLEAGADAYFTKPFDPDEIIATIRDLIEK